MEFLASDGTLFYEVTGQGQLLLLIHGNGEDHSIFDKAVAVLKDHFRVYALDSRGHGQSFPVDVYHYQDMAEDVRQFITGLALEKPILCGFSDGGILGLLLASQYPDLLGGVIACGVNTRPEGIRPFWLMLFRLMYRFNRSPLFRLMLTEPDISSDQLSKITCPVLVTGGSRDMISPKHLEEVARQIPGARLCILSGEGHGSYIIGSEKIAQIVLDFVRQQEK